MKSNKLSGNYIEAAGQTDAGEYMQITFATALDLSQYNFIGIWRQSDTTTGATDYDLEFLDSDGTVIRSFNLPIATASVWQYVEIDISGDIRTDVKYIRIVCDVADNDTIDYCNLIAYEYGNGSGPVDGICEILTSTAAITRGDLVQGTPGRPGYATQGTNNNEHIKGKAITTVTAGDVAIVIQVTGEVYQRCDGASVAAGDPAAAVSQLLADDDTTANRAFGTWKETSGTAAADLKLVLGTMGAANVTIGDHDHASSGGNHGGTLTWADILAVAAAGDHTHADNTTGNTLTWANILAVAAAGNHTHADNTAGNTLTWANALAVAAAGDHTHADNTAGDTLAWTDILAAAGDGDHTHADDTTGNTLTWANILAAAADGDHTHADNTTGNTLTWANILAAAADGDHTHADNTTGNTLTWANALAVAAAGDHNHAANTAGGTLTWANALAVAAAGNHDHTANTSGNVITRVDKQYTPDFLSGQQETGAIYVSTAVDGLPILTRTTDQNTNDYFLVALELGARTTATSGVMITSVEMSYSVNTADAGDDIQLHVCTRELPANGAAHGAIATIAGDADVDYDGDHDTAAERVVDTAGPELHTLVMTIPGGDQAYIADDETWFIRIWVNEADDATGALVIVINDIIVRYTEIY